MYNIYRQMKNVSVAIKSKVVFQIHYHEDITILSSANLLACCFIYACLSFPHMPNGLPV